MTQALGRNDSAGKVLRASRRHVRLAKRTGDARAAEIAGRLVEPRAALEAAVAGLDRAGEESQDAFDDWVVRDQLLDGTVGSMDRKCTHRAWVDAVQRQAVAATAVEVAKLQVIRV